ncbi:MAG: hypothetical protein KA072_07245 [Thermoanaerobaculaceae bacterium]|nr:hypothetical protein [Thermoanaerobaculaceae bacterium]MDI9622224.1 hypothetical protein [Acidobacteriota bacterium]NLH10544.1 hypothetical protein [Holophagae bacterium]HPW56848.1 hypothetical protein [Thermoanaerobaculaceae bacterium]
MGAEPPVPLARGEELTYYRTVEDAFAVLRGTVFIFKPKDFALLQGWWRAGVPLAAVMAGLAEVFDRARQRGADPPSSLAYCRHAVNRHAKRLATAHVGGGAAAPEVEVGPALARLAQAVTLTADRWQASAPVAGVLESLARAIEGIPAGAPPAAVEATLEKLETGALEALFAALPDGDREAVLADVDEQPLDPALTPEVAARSRRALQVRAVRERIGLPRLELNGV